MLILIGLMILQIHDVVIMFWLSRVRNKKNFSSLDHLNKITAIKYRNNVVICLYAGILINPAGVDNSSKLHYASVDFLIL